MSSKAPARSSEAQAALSSEAHAPTRDHAEAADRADVLAPIQELFQLPKGVIYLDGNSLGAAPVAVTPLLDDVVTRQWGQDLITSWNINGWWELPARLGDQVGALIGAAAGQVICGDSTSVQLFQALVAACRLRPGRTVILTDGANFPTDQYIADSVARLLGLQVIRCQPSEVAEHLDERVAVASFSLVDYRTGELFDADELTRTVHRAGALMLWDLCHAAGALPVSLDAIEADFAVGCTYKYLNGGPGSPAFIYLAQRHQAAVDLPLTGWNGHRTPFQLAQHYHPAESIEQARIGTPPLLSLAALGAGLAVFVQAQAGTECGSGLEGIRAKSLALTDRAIAFADSSLATYGVEVVTPREHRRRGSQVSLRMEHAFEVCQALIARGVIGDFRAPDLLRLGFTPLYLRHVDVHDAMTVLADVLESKSYLDPSYASRTTVT